ncbi:MAG: alpha-L-fucosidase [Prevotella sp.]|nr:alpha-L-fucosidase [Prevotella sp.]
MLFSPYHQLFKAALCACTVFSPSFLASVHAQDKNFVAISASDSLSDIVRKAAHVVPSPRQFNWQRQELTAFLHFGVNTFTDREWGDGTEPETVFNPTALDADQWIRELKAAGFKCAILTCKHHDGFCLWPSAYTEHSVRRSPWKNGMGDVVREVSDACQRHGMSFGVYLSPWDRNSQLYGTDAYNDYFVSQLTELLTQYGKVSEVWFDGACGEGPNGKKQVYDFVRWYEVIRRLQPDAVIAVMGPDVRWVGTETGRGREMEWSVVPKDNLDQDAIAQNSQKEVLTQPVGDMMGHDLGSRTVIEKAKALVWYPAEIDVSIRPGWFYHEQENSKVKAPRELMDIYFSSVGMNGVLLLNVPPDKEGRLSAADVESLRGFRQLYDATFASNLLAGASVRCGASSGKFLVDGDYDTSISPVMQDGKAVFYFKLKRQATFNVLSVQEDIRKGQRVEQFFLEVKGEDGRWRKVAEGSTVGYKRLLKFPMLTAREVRLTILQSRDVPAVAEVGLYALQE